MTLAGTTSSSDARLPAAPAATGASSSKVWFAHSLRAVACLLVVFHHLGYRYESAPSTVWSAVGWPTTTPVPHPFWVAPLISADQAGVDLGQIGVAVFFLISGFVIPFSLQRGRARTFAVRRILRIYPVYWLALAFSIGLITLQAAHAGIPSPVGRSIIPANALLLQTYSGQRSIDLVNWTLVIEDFFYVVAVVLMLTSAIRRPAGLIVTAVVLGSIAIATGSLAGPTWSIATALNGIGGVCHHVIFLLIGVVFHNAYRRTWSRSTALTTALILGVIYAVATYVSVQIAAQRSIYLVSNAIALVIFTAAYIGRDRIPKWRLLGWVADISFPLYVVHAVTGYLLLPRFYVLFGDRFAPTLAATVAVVITLAYIVHRFVEQPSIAMGRRISKRFSNGGEGAVASTVVPAA